MAARAHAVHDYSFSGSPVRQRRQVWLHDEEPVVLPRGRSEARGGAVLVISALLASVLVAGATYAVYRTAPPELAETPSAPFMATWEPDNAVARASAVNALLGPAIAVPGAASAAAGSDEPEPFVDVPQATPSRDPQVAQSREVISDDSAPGLQQALPRPAREPSPLVPDASPLVPEPPSATPAAPYPNPTITPPEMIAPPSSMPEAPPVNSDAENPY